MKVVINNNHKSFPHYNLFKWVDEIVNWPDGIFEIDYFRYYKYTSTNTDLSSCKTYHTDHTSFDVFPNPSNGKITVATNSDLLIKHLRIINSVGIVLYQTSFASKELMLDLTIPSGLYFVELYSNGNRHCKKIIIE